MEWIVSLLAHFGLNRALEYSVPLTWPCNIKAVKLIDRARTIWGNTVCIMEPFHFHTCQLKSLQSSIVSRHPVDNTGRVQVLESDDKPRVGICRKSILFYSVDCYQGSAFIHCYTCLECTCLCMYASMHRCMYYFLLLDGAPTTSIWRARLVVGAQRRLELLANFFEFESSIPTIILFIVFCKLLILYQEVQ